LNPELSGELTILEVFWVLIGPCVNLFPAPYQMVDWKNIHFYVIPRNNPGLKPYPSGEMVASPVSGKVNKATYDAPL